MTETEKHGSGFIVDLNPPFHEHHKEYSKIMLKAVWSNLDGLFTGPRVRTITFQPDEWGKLTIYRMTGFSWIHLLVLPFGLFHESLHFLIAMLTSNKYIITLIPPIIDLSYLPLAFYLLISNHIGPLSVIAIWLELVWMFMFTGNLSGDFKILRSPKIEKADSPHED